MPHDVFKNINRSMFGVWMKEVLERIEGYLDDIDTGSLPTGGATGQVLTKQSSADGDAVWGNGAPSSALVINSGTSAPSGTPASGNEIYRQTISIAGVPKEITWVWSGGAWRQLQAYSGLGTNQRLWANGVVPSASNIGPAVNAVTLASDVVPQRVELENDAGYSTTETIFFPRLGEFNGNNAFIYATAPLQKIYADAEYKCIMTWQSATPYSAGGIVPQQTSRNTVVRNIRLSASVNTQAANADVIGLYTAGYYPATGMWSMTHARLILDTVYVEQTGIGIWLDICQYNKFDNLYANGCTTGILVSNHGAGEILTLDGKTGRKLEVTPNAGWVSQAVAVGDTLTTTSNGASHVITAIHTWPDGTKYVKYRAAGGPYLDWPSDVQKGGVSVGASTTNSGNLNSSDWGGFVDMDTNSRWMTNQCDVGMILLSRMNAVYPINNNHVIGYIARQNASGDIIGLRLPGAEAGTFDIYGGSNEYGDARGGYRERAFRYSDGGPESTLDWRVASVYLDQWALNLHTFTFNVNTNFGGYLAWVKNGARLWTDKWIGGSHRSFVYGEDKRSEVVIEGDCINEGTICNLSKFPRTVINVGREQTCTLEGKVLGVAQADMPTDMLDANWTTAAKKAPAWPNKSGDVTETTVTDPVQGGTISSFTFPSAITPFTTRVTSRYFRGWGSKNNPPSNTSPDPTHAPIAVNIELYNNETFPVRVAVNLTNADGVYTYTYGNVNGTTALSLYSTALTGATTIECNFNSGSDYIGAWVIGQRVSIVLDDASTHVTKITGNMVEFYAGSTRKYRFTIADALPSQASAGKLATFSFWHNFITLWPKTWQRICLQRGTMNGDRALSIYAVDSGLGTTTIYSRWLEAVRAVDPTTGAYRIEMLPYLSRAVELGHGKR